MKKVLIISISTEYQKKLDEAQSRTPSQQIVVETTASFGQEASWWTENSPDCLIISLPTDDLMQGYFLTKLRADVPRSLPILIICDSISGNLMQLSQIFSKVRLLKGPVEGYTILRSIIDLTTHFEGRQQVHPRYLTDQSIRVSMDLSEIKFDALMKNLSLSGAYFESAESEAHLKPGDIIKISVQLGEPTREYFFDARVVWSKPLDGKKAGYGFGVSFINKEDVYNNLLKGF